MTTFSLDARFLECDPVEVGLAFEAFHSAAEVVLRNKHLHTLHWFIFWEMGTESGLSRTF